MGTKIFEGKGKFDEIVFNVKSLQIKGVIVNLDELLGQIRSDRNRSNSEENIEPLSFNIYKKKPAKDQSALSINRQFIQFELLIDCLLRIETHPTDRKRALNLCREVSKGNTIDLSIIDEFERTYTQQNALWWCIKDSFISRLLNQTLEEQKIDVLYSLRFFLQDVDKQLQLNRCSSTIRTYCGRSLTHEQFQTLKKSIGDYISINSFLSTTLNCQTALKHLPTLEKSNGFLFEIDVDPNLSGMKSFGSTNQSDEILFMIGSIFRIDDIIYQAKQPTIIRMTLISNNDSQMQIDLNSFKSDVNTDEMNSLIFGEILYKMGKFIHAEKYYRKLLTEFSSEDFYQISQCYFALGNLAMERNDEKTSLEYHQKSLNSKREIFDDDNPSIADSYNSFADIERKKGNATEALEWYHKALNIWTRAYGNDHQKIGMCLNNIACLYGEQKDFEKTLEYQQKALEIMQKHFSAEHLCLGQAHNNIGSVYRCLKQYDRALEHYRISMEIKSKSFSAKHPSMALAYNNIANVYEEMNQWKQGLEYYEKAAAIYRQRFPPTYPENLRVAEDIRRVTDKLKH